MDILCFCTILIALTPKHTNLDNLRMNCTMTLLITLIVLRVFSPVILTGLIRLSYHSMISSILVGLSLAYPRSSSSLDFPPLNVFIPERLIVVLHFSIKKF